MADLARQLIGQITNRISEPVTFECLIDRVLSTVQACLPPLYRSSFTFSGLQASAVNLLAGRA